MTQVAEALRDAARQLESVSDTARLDAELLMAEALGVNRSELLLRHMDAQVPGGFASFLARRMRHEPVAYIVGRQEFYGREFIVTPDVLIPRGDSETLIEAALRLAPDAKRILDCGSGSGALLLTLLAEMPDAEGIGTDRSLGALGVAAANAARLGLAARARFLRRDWREAGWAAGLGRFDLVIANPPYVEESAALAPQVREYEPAGALFAGADGLDDYRRLAPVLAELLISGAPACLEMGSGQADAIAQIAQAHDFEVEIVPDLAGRPRVAILRLGLGKAEQPG